MERTKPTLFLSNMTLAGIRNPRHLFWGYHNFDAFARDIDVPFIQQHPLRTPLIEMQTRIAYLAHNGPSNRIRALHTSWRGEEVWYSRSGRPNVWSHPNRMRAAYSKILLPYRSSREMLLKIQEDLGVGRLPLLEYTEDIPGSRFSNPFAETVVQIADSQMERWGVATVDQFIRQAKRRHCKIALDLALFRKLPEGQEDKWQDAIIPILQDRDTTEVHFPLVRDDFGDKGEDLREFLRGNKAGALHRFLQIIKETDWSGRIVLEGSIDGILQATGEQKALPPRRRIVQQMKDIVDPIKEALGLV